MTVDWFPVNILYSVFHRKKILKHEQAQLCFVMQPHLKTSGIKSFFLFLATILIIVSFAISLTGCSTFVSKRKNHNPELGNRIVKIAAQYKGTPYKWSGTTPDGFDCSGFTSYVYKKAGMTIPRTTSLQYGSGQSVNRSDLQKGDLVFFMQWPVIGFILPPNHVGIYIGNNQFIHAPSSGGSVRYDSLNNSYWKSHYKGARGFN